MVLGVGWVVAVREGVDTSPLSWAVSMDPEAKGESTWRGSSWALVRSLGMSMQSITHVCSCVSVCDLCFSQRDGHHALLTEHTPGKGT